MIVERFNRDGQGVKRRGRRATAAEVAVTRQPKAGDSDKLQRNTITNYFPRSCRDKDAIISIRTPFAETRWRIPTLGTATISQEGPGEEAPATRQQRERERDNICPLTGTTRSANSVSRSESNHRRRPLSHTFAKVIGSGSCYLCPGSCFIR